MKLYKITGTVLAEYVERDEWDAVVNRVEKTGEIETTLPADRPTQAAELALKQWGLRNDFPMGCLSWLELPTIEPAPVDQQLIALGAPMLPGLEETR